MIQLEVSSRLGDNRESDTNSSYIRKKAVAIVILSELGKEDIPRSKFARVGLDIATNCGAWLTHHQFPANGGRDLGKA